MSKNNGLHEAANRLRKHLQVVRSMEYARNSPYTWIEVSTGTAGMVNEAMQKDMATVAGAYLDEHPADDD